MNYSTPGLPVHHQLPEFTQTHIHRVGDANQPSHPLSSPFPPAPISPSISVFSNESILRMRWPKYWSFSFSIISSKEHPELISFRMDWLDLLAVQGTLKSLLQHRNSKASILRCSAFFTVQLSYPYMTTGKTLALTRRTLGKRDKKAFFSDHCKEIEENNRMGKTRDLFREGNGNPLQYSCLENPMDGGAWWAAVHGVPESWA